MQTKLLSMLSHVGHMRDPRASTNMVPDEVWASLPLDLEVVELERRRTALKGGKYCIKGSPYEREVWLLTRSRPGLSGGRRRSSNYTDSIISTTVPPGTSCSRKMVKGPSSMTSPQLSERAALAELLCHQPDDLSPEELHRHCIRAGTCMGNLGQLKEPASLRSSRG